MILEYLLLLLPTIIHAVIDYKGAVKHWLNPIYVILIAVLIGLFLPGYWWQGAFYALCIHFSIFDIIYNISHKHPLLYHGDINNLDRAFTDKIWDKFSQPPHAEIFLRIWVLIVGIYVYYELERIIRYIP